MKISTTFSFLLAIGFSLVTLFSCGEQCEETREFVTYTPVYIDQEEYEREVRFEAPREVEIPGVIAQYQNYLFINEYNKGIHVINNTDPASPVNEAFIAINNNKHFAIKDGIVLANRYGDLVAIDIRNPQSVQELQRIEQVFPDEATVTEDGIISHYELSNEILTQTCEDPWLGNVWMQNDNLFLSTSEGFSATSMSNSTARAFQSSGTTNVSVSSSSARFTITKGHLYVMNNPSLEIFDVSDATNPQRTFSANIPGDAETLFPLNDYLFVGARTGMSIYSLENPRSPQWLSSFEHAFSCDPVVANESNAYVTLRSGTPCQGFVNELNVLNIENVRSPRLISTHDLSSPRGLTLVGHHLLVCDDEHGVIVYDVEHEGNVRQIGSYGENQANDILPVSQNVVVVSGDDGIFQLDISDLTNPKLLSFVSIN